MGNDIVHEALLAEIDALDKLEKDEDRFELRVKIGGIIGVLSVIIAFILFA